MAAAAHGYGHAPVQTPAVTGYVQGLHPIRPGAPNCPQWLNYGRCEYFRNCPCNHPTSGGGYAMPAAGFAPAWPQQLQQTMMMMPYHQQQAYQHQQYHHQQQQQQQMMQQQQPHHRPYQAAQYYPQPAAQMYAGRQYSSDGGGGQQQQQHYAPQQPRQQQPVPPPRPPPQPQAQAQQQQQPAKAVPVAVPTASHNIDQGAAGLAASSSADALVAPAAAPVPGAQHHSLASPVQEPAAAAAAHRNAPSGPPQQQQHAAPSSAAMGTVLLAALQQHGGHSSSNNNNNNTSASSSSAAAGAGAGGASSSSSSASAQPGASGGGGTRVSPSGIYLQNVPADTTRQELEACSQQFGSVVRVVIFPAAKQFANTNGAFVDFQQEAAAAKALSQKILNIADTAVRVLPRLVKGSAAAKAGNGGASGSQPGGQPQQTSTAGAASSAGASAAGSAVVSTGAYGSLLSPPTNDEGLPRRRSACCPYYGGTGWCRFGSTCKYHHPSSALHPSCVASGQTPHRYKCYDQPSYARLVNFVSDRLWDYTSCVEAQLKIWVARHLIASENSGCGMWDESAAVPAAVEWSEWQDEKQPLGPYSCSLDEADRMLQALWKIQPDEAAQQDMPYSGRVHALLAGDPYYELSATDPNSSSAQQWVQLRVGRVKELLNY